MTDTDKIKLRKLTKAHKVSQMQVAQASGLAEADLVGKLASGGLTDTEFLVQAVAVNQVGFRDATRLAGVYVRQARGLMVPELAEVPVVVPKFDVVQSLLRAESTIRVIDGLLSDDEHRGKKVEHAAGVLRQWTASNVANAHRQTVMRSAEAAGSGWRVVTDGKPCAFCAMLASYGEDINGAWAWPDHYFHHDCGCTIQEVPFGVDVEFTAREREFVELRELADEQADLFPGGLKRQRLMAAMRANGQGVVNDAIVPEEERKPKGRPKKNRSLSAPFAKDCYPKPRGARPATVEEVESTRASLGRITRDTPELDHVLENHSASAIISRKSHFKTDDPEIIARILDEAVHGRYSVAFARGEQLQFWARIEDEIVVVNVRNYPDGSVKLWTGYPYEEGR